MTVTPFPQREGVRFVDDLLGYMTLSEKLGQLDLARPADDPGLSSAISSGEVGGILGGRNARRLQGFAVEHSRLGIPLLIVSEDDAPQSPWALAASWDEDTAYAAGRSRAHAARRACGNMMNAPRLDLTGLPETAAACDLAGCEAHLMAKLGQAFAAGSRSIGDHAQGGVAAVPTIAPGASPASAARCAAELALTRGLIGLDTYERTGGGIGGLSQTLQLSECRRLLVLVKQVFATTTTATMGEAAQRAIASDLLSLAEIEQAVRGVLLAKHRLGLFRDPYGKGCAVQGGTASSASDVALRSMVLLRNEGGLLPLSAVSDRVLVVGALDGSGAACSEALRRSGVDFLAAPGLALRTQGESWANLNRNDQLALALTRDAAERADFVLLVLEERHFQKRGADDWQTPTPAVTALIQALSRTSARLVALLTTREPVELGETDRHFAAVLQCWQPVPGFEEALADILSGRRGPEGRMPITVGHFPAGHGLGLGDCVISNYRLEAGDDSVAATARVRNSGAFAMKETVQVYVRGDEGQLRLAGFTRVTLEPDEDVPIRIDLSAAALGEVDHSGRFRVSPGRREILIGKSVSRLLPAEITITDVLARAITTGRAIPIRAAVGSG